MLTSTVDRIRVWIATKYLDWAEMLPNFNGGVFAYLQGIRKGQRERAEEAYEESRPPEGAALLYRQLLVFELFPIEEFVTLEKCLRNLFPEEPFGRDPLNDFFSSANSLYGGGDYLVGFLAREKTRVFARPVRILSRLRSEIAWIEVRVIHPVFSSAFVVCFSVRLEDSATAQLEKLQSRRYLGDVRFREWFPSAMGGCSEHPPETAHARAVIGWMNHLRFDLEQVLRFHCRGFFGNLPSKYGEPCFPAIEEFHVDDSVGTSIPMDEWLKQNHGWARSIGLDRSLLEHYRSEDAIFIPGGKFSVRDTVGSSATRPESGYWQGIRRD